MTEARHRAEIPTDPEPNHKWRNFWVLVAALAALAAVAVPVGWLVKTKVDAWVGRPDSHAHVTAVAATPTLACPSPPAGKTQYKLLYNSQGRAYVNGRRVKADEGQDWIASYFPKPGPARSAMYQWTISPYGETHAKGAGAWGIITNGRDCVMKTLVSTESSVVYDVDGVKVPATNLTLVVPSGYRLGSVTIALIYKDPREAN